MDAGGVAINAGGVLIDAGGVTYITQERRESMNAEERRMTERIHRFTHHDLSGAVLRILDDKPHSLNELLDDEYQLRTDRSVPFSYTCCYVHHRGRHVMVDAGIDGDEVAATLRELDVTPDDIDLVLITHVDRDHVAGLILQMGDGVLAYPNARYAIDAGLWAELQKDETYDGLPKHLQRLFRTLVERVADRIILCPGEGPLAGEYNGITFIPCPGHRPGHGAYEFAASEEDGAEAEPFIHVGDAFLNPFFVEHPDWPVTGDSLPDQAVESRKRLIDRLNASSALVLATHFPFPGLGQVLADGDSAEWIGL